MVRDLDKESRLSQEGFLRTYKLAVDVLLSDTSAIKQDTAQILREIAHWQEQSTSPRTVHGNEVCFS